MKKRDLMLEIFKDIEENESVVAAFVGSETIAAVLVGYNVEPSQPMIDAIMKHVEGEIEWALDQLIDDAIVDYFSERDGTTLALDETELTPL